nr:hypothetical protein CFP56_22304 [Quercus suber]
MLCGLKDYRDVGGPDSLALESGVSIGKNRFSSMVGIWTYLGRKAQWWVLPKRKVDGAHWLLAYCDREEVNTSSTSGQAVDHYPIAETIILSGFAHEHSMARECHCSFRNTIKVLFDIPRGGESSTVMIDRSKQRTELERQLIPPACRLPRSLEGLHGVLERSHFANNR